MFSAIKGGVVTLFVGGVILRLLGLTTGLNVDKHVPIAVLAPGLFFTGFLVVFVLERLQSQTESQAGNLQEDSARTPPKAYPWEEDPWDFSPLPYIRLTDLPERAYDSYMRKHRARSRAEELLEEEQRRGMRVLEQAKEAWIQKEAARVARISDDVEWEQQEQERAKRGERRRHQELVDAIENSTQFGRSRRFKQDHPFLAGLMGSENVDKLTGQGWWKG